MSSSLGNIIELLKQSEFHHIQMENEWHGHIGGWIIDMNDNRFYANPMFFINLGLDHLSLQLSIDLDLLYNQIALPDDMLMLKGIIDDRRQGNKDVIEHVLRLQGAEQKTFHYFLNGRLTTTQDGQVYIIGEAYDVTHQNLSKKELKQQTLPAHQAMTRDALTGLISPNYMDEHLSHAITLARAGQQNFCLLMADLDFFHNINEHFGRESGDLVLIEVARILQKETRNTDFVGRLEGDLFQIILSDVNERTGQQIGERIRKAIANHMFVSGIRITISGGLVFYNKHHHQELIDHANRLLKYSKSNGHNKMTY